MIEVRTWGLTTPLGSQQGFNGLAIKADHILLPFLNDRHPFLPGQLEHPGHGHLVLGKIEFLNSQPFLAKELFRGQTLRSGRQGIDGYFFHGFFLSYFG